MVEVAKDGAMNHSKPQPIYKVVIGLGKSRDLICDKSKLNAILTKCKTLFIYCVSLLMCCIIQ